MPLPAPVTNHTLLILASLRCLLENHFSLLQLKIDRPGGGIPILPMYCLFLLMIEESLGIHRADGYPKVRGVNMRHRIHDALLLRDRARELRSELARKITAHMGSAENRATDIPGLSLHRRTAPTAPCSATYEPGITVMAQGRKRVDLGKTTFIYGESRYLLTSLDLPIVSQIIEASEEVPCLAISMKLEMPVIRELLSREEIQMVEAPADAPAMATGKVTAEFLSACCRLVDLLDTPQDIPFLSGLIQREIIYRILRGPEGARLRAIATLG